MINMKRAILLTTRTVTFISMMAVLTLFTSCSKKLSFAKSVVVPAAEGTVKVKKDKNENYNIQVKVKNLAEPKRLQPPKDTYIVWMETKNNEVKNLGKLKSESGFFTSGLKASLETVTSFKPHSFFITAEDAGNVTYPGNFVVLRTGNY
jgi:hypothetical protein